MVLPDIKFTSPEEEKAAILQWLVDTMKKVVELQMECFNQTYQPLIEINEIFLRLKSLLPIFLGQGSYPYGYVLLNNFNQPLLRANIKPDELHKRITYLSPNPKVSSPLLLSQEEKETIVKDLNWSDEKSGDFYYLPRLGMVIFFVPIYTADEKNVKYNFTFSFLPISSLADLFI